MSKRRINNQQSARIKKIQDNYRDVETESNSLRYEGLVLTRFARHAEVETAEKKLILCSIRPNIDSLVAGDKVICQPEGKNQGVVISRFPRATVLARADKRGTLRPVAANITQIIIVIAAKPLLSWSLLDSYLVMAECLEINACILLNKMDLPSSLALQEELLQSYSPLGYKILFSSKNGSGYTELQTALSEQTSVFVGQSGVGKSSLIEAFLPPETSISIANISAASELGCHTTRNSRFYHLLGGGALIDSPGVREFSLDCLPSSEVAQGFREMKSYISQCKFRNCNHLDVPGCAIFAAYQQGIISEKRYKSFINLTHQRNTKSN